MNDESKLEEMFDYCMDFARTMLVKAGEFHPFGCFIGNDGKLAACATWDGNECPLGADAYLQMVEALKLVSEQQAIQACAIAANVNIPASYEPTYPDGVRISMESPTYSRFHYVPYRITKKLLSRRVIAEGEMFPVEKANEVFVIV